MTIWRPVVVVISSHVAFGAVGNRIMVPVLEELGFDVWVVPTITLPFHPGMGKGTRIVPSDDAFSSFLKDLAKREEAQRICAVVSGYFSSLGQVDAVADFVRVAKGLARCTYVCDPVIGDKGGLYVDASLAAAIRDHLLPLANVITPNAFEHAWLVGKTSAAQSLDELIGDTKQIEVPLQVITSSGTFNASQRTGLVSIGDTGLVECITHEKLASAPNGTGDLFTATWSGLLLRYERDGLARAVCKVVRSVKESPPGSKLVVAPGYDLVDQLVTVHTQKLK